MAATGYGQAADLTRVAKAGDTMTGPLILSEDPLQPLEAANKEYVDTHGGGGSGTVKSVNNQTPDASGNVSLTAGNVGALAAVSNLSDLTSAAAARVNLGLGTAATLSSSAVLLSVNSLSDVGSVATARANLGLGTASTFASSAFAQTANNLSDLGSAGTARNNLGLGSAATFASSAFVAQKSPVNLVDGATIATDASSGNLFRVTLGGNRTLSNPTNATDGQLITWSLKQDATGGRTIALDTKFRFGTDITSVTLSTSASKTDHLGVRYNGVDDRFDVIAFVRGF